MIDLDQLGKDREFLATLDVAFDGLEDDRVLRILQSLQVANRNAERWKAIALDLYHDVDRLCAKRKQVTITLPDGVTISCDAAVVGDVMKHVTPSSRR